MNGSKQKQEKKQGKSNGAKSPNIVQQPSKRTGGNNGPTRVIGLPVNGNVKLIAVKKQPTGKFAAQCVGTVPLFGGKGGGSGTRGSTTKSSGGLSGLGRKDSNISNKRVGKGTAKVQPTRSFSMNDYSPVKNPNSSIPKGNVALCKYDPAKYQYKMGKIESRRDDAPLNTAAKITSPEEGTRTSGNFNQLRVTTRDFVQALNVAGTEAPGDIIASWAASPSAFYTTRMKKMTDCFAKVVVHEIRIIVESCVSAMTDGSLIGGVVPDPNIQLSGGEEAIRVLMSTEGATQWNVWESAVVAYKPDDSLQRFTNITGVDPRFQSLGYIVIICASAFTEAKTLGNMYIEFDMTFYQPALSVLSFTGNSWMAFVNSGTRSAAFPYSETPDIPPMNPSNIPVNYIGSTASIVHSTFELPPGCYCIVSQITGTTLVGQQATLGDGVEEFQTWGPSLKGDSTTSILIIFLRVNPVELDDRWFQIWLTSAASVTSSLISITQTLDMIGPSLPMSPEEMEERLLRVEQSLKEQCSSNNAPMPIMPRLSKVKARSVRQ